MVLAFPRDLVFEAYLGRWVDVTALVEGRALRQVEPVTITRGLPNEQGKALAPPQTLDCVLNNTGGHWTPGNAVSDYYQYLQGRNVPARLALRIMRDAFGRTLPTDWGFTDTGDGWINGGGLNDSYSVGSGVGNILVNGTLSFGFAVLGDSYLDGEVRGTCTVAINDILGGAIEPANLMLRYQPSGPQAGQYYMLRVSVSASEVLTVSIMYSDSTVLAGPVTVPGLVDAVSAKALRAAFMVEGQTLRGKVWSPTGDEPLGWQVSCHDERLQRIGAPGIRCGVAFGNTNTKPITFKCDDMEFRLPRFTGEVQKLTPGWDQGHRIKTARVKAAGISMRLNRPQTPPLRSVIERHVVLNAIQPAAYWSMDDGPLSTEGRVVAGAGTDAYLDDPNQTGILHLPLGTGFAPPWLLPIANIRDKPIARFEPAVPIVGGYTWHCAISHVGGRYTSSSNLDAFTFVGNFILQLFSDSYTVQIFGSFGTSSVVVPQLFDQKLHHMALQVLPVGADWTWVLYVDGLVVMSGLVVASTVPTLTRVQYQQNGHAEGHMTRSLGHTAMYAGTGPSIPGWSDALFGRVGERALARAIRLCAEEGVLFDYWGDPSQTPAMGPQGVKSLLEHLSECAEAAGAVVYEPRSTAGLAMRTRTAMSARAPDATLNYAAGHVATPLAPSADDRLTANRVTATRLDGGTFVVDTPAGPMNTKDPGTDADAVGVAPASVKVNVEADALLPNAAGWARALGTVPDVRFPRVTVDLRANEFIDPHVYLIPASVLALNVGDRLLVQNMQAADSYRDLDQVVRGLTETYGNVRKHKVTLNTSPYEKFRTGVFGDTEARYADMGGTTLDASLTTTATGARNVTTSVGLGWTVDAAMYPLDVDIEGERVTLSGTTGAGAAQVMTISARSVNGAVKAHAAGAVVRLWQPVYYG